jgi:hypothetical protein
MKQPVAKNQYMMYVDFTTVKGSHFTGRSAEISIESALPLEEVKKDTDLLKQLAVNYILSQKPNWQILMLDIKSIQ